jgi:hypothetical protein
MFRAKSVSCPAGSAPTEAAPIATGAPPTSDGLRKNERRIARLIGRLPAVFQPTIRWLRRPSSRRVRIPAGLLLIGGGVFGILPIFGLWMLPLGLMLLAEDVPLLRRALDRSLDWVERHRPHWFANHTESRSRAQLPHSSGPLRRRGGRGLCQDGRHGGSQSAR